MARGASGRPDGDRRARVEQLRREERQRERRRTLLVVGAALVAGLLVIGLAVWQLLDRDGSTDAALADIGLPAAEAGCQDPVVEVPRGSEVSGSPTSHVGEGVSVRYRFAPPAFGQHWDRYLTPTDVREFWDEEDRPALERLVHSLEHGWTIVWYDEEVAGDAEQVEQLEAVADRFADAAPDEQKLMVAPFTAQDGEAADRPFPAGQHVALTHWSVAGDPDVGGGQQGVWQYCEQVSGEAVSTFTETYTWEDSPEAGAY